MNDANDNAVRLRTGWEIKLLAISAAIIAVGTIAGLLMLWDALVVAEQAIEAMNGLETQLAEVNR